MNQRYLNFSFAPIVSPLQKSLQIELYNDTYFPSNSKHITAPTVDQKSSHVDELALREHQDLLSISSATSLFEDSKTPLPKIEEDICTSLDIFSDTVDLNNKLFFIQFTPEGTMRRRWYLIQIDIESTMEVNPDFLSNNLYWCIFLARHPNDNKKSDEFCRWWPDWYRYTHCPKSDDIIYGHRILIRSNILPCSKKFIQ